MNKQLVNTMLQSEDFQQLIDEAAPYRVKIMTEYSVDLANLRDEFAQMMIDLDTNLKRISEIKAKDRTDDEQATYKMARKKFKQQFTSVKRIIHPNDKKNGEPQDPIGLLIDKVANIGQMLQYIGRSELVDRFKEAGIEIKFKPIEEDIPEMDNQNTRNLIKGVFDDADQLQGKICRAADEIKINIYNKIDESIKYSAKDPENKSGIRPSQFQKLVKTKAVSLVKAAEDFAKFKEAVVQRDEANLISQQGTLEKNKAI